MDSVPAALRGISVAPEAWAEALLDEADDLAMTCDRYQADQYFIHSAPVRAMWDADAAETIAKNIHNPESRVSALVRVAKVVAERDQVRASRLLAAAGHAARDADSYSSSYWPAEIAKETAAWDPAEAERIARSIHDDEEGQPRALKDVAVAAAEHHPAEGERIARSLKDEPYWETLALCGVAGVLAKRDPGRAAALISDAYTTARRMRARSSGLGWGLTLVAERLIDSDPQRARGLFIEAERIARSLEPDYRKTNLWRLAEGMAALDPAAAQRIAGDITEDFSRQQALSDVAIAVAAADPVRARSIALSISGGDPGDRAFHRTCALAGIAQVIITDAPARAAALLAEAEHEARTLDRDSDREGLLEGIGQLLARIDPAAAALIADTLADSPSDQATVLASAARATAERDPTRAAGILAAAERAARLVGYPLGRATTLAFIVFIELGPYPQCLVTHDLN